MSIIEKVFHYEENEITVIKCRDDIWFRGKDIAKALGYSIPCKAIREHVDPEDRSSLECLTKGLKWTPLKNEQKSAIFVNESGLYSLILQSKLESAKVFKRWVTIKTLVSNDYDQIIEQVIEYFRDVRILCSYCPRRFISSQSLRNHIKFFHKM